MEKRFFLFIVLASALLFANMLLVNWLTPPQPPKPKPPQQQAKKEEPKPDEPPAPAPAAPPPAVHGAPKGGPEEELAPQWFSLGSLDPADPYRMLVIVTSRGAAVERIELNTPQLRDVDEGWGYLGRLGTEGAPEGAGVI